MSTRLLREMTVSCSWWPDDFHQIYNCMVGLIGVSYCKEVKLVLLHCPQTCIRMTDRTPGPVEFIKPM